MVRSGVRWYDLQAGATRSTGAGVTLARVLTLTPGLYDEKGDCSALNMDTDQPRPGH